MLHRRQGQELVEAGLLNLDVLQSRRKKLRFGRSSVHAWGVFADEPIAAGDLVIEYRWGVSRCWCIPSWLYVWGGYWMGSTTVLKVQFRFSLGSIAPAWGCCKNANILGRDNIFWRANAPKTRNSVFFLRFQVNADYNSVFSCVRLRPSSTLRSTWTPPLPAAAPATVSFSSPPPR